MIVLLQSYLGMSDAEAVELTVVDLRWQMVLDCLGADKPACAQGTLVDFRERLIRTDMDRRLLERTVELARQTEAFRLEEAAEESPRGNRFQSAGRRGRVEDTINLLGHAARKVVLCVADLLGWTADRVAREAGIPALLEASVSAHSTPSGAIQTPRMRRSTLWCGNSIHSTRGCDKGCPRNCESRR